MKARLNTLVGQAQQELNSFGAFAICRDKNQVWDRSLHTLSSAYRRTARALILRLMAQFARDFVASIEGTKVGVSKTSIMLLYYSCKDWSRVYRRTSVSAYFIQSEIGNNLMGTRLWQLEWKNSPKFGRYAIANQILPSLNPLPKPQEQTRSIWPRHPMPNRSLVHRRIQKIRPNPPLRSTG